MQLVYTIFKKGDELAMLDLELLEELVTFKKYGTLSATAEHLMITQPSVTRGMKRLEQELGVTLFDRTVNRITLNKTGKLAAEEAEKLLQAENDFTEKVLNFSRTQNYINIGTTLPGPLVITDQYKDSFKEKTNINHQLILENNVISYLRNYKERLIFTTEDIETDDIESMYLGQEKLSIRIDKFNPLSQKKSVTFKDLAGLSFLVVQSIGPWKKVIENNIPDAKFLYQDDLAALDELTHYSNFPVFRSNLTIKSTFKERDDDDRVLVPIEDENNFLDIYGTYLQSQRRVVQPYLKQYIKIIEE